MSASPALSIGLTPVILADQAAFLSRWGSYLHEHTGLEVTFVVRDDYRRILDLLFDRTVNAAWICGYPYVLHRSRLRRLVTPLYRNQPTYRAYLIGNRSGKVLGWQDLAGHVLAFSDPLSNSGWLVAQAELARVGLSMHDLRRTFFTHGHRNVIEAVAVGLADAGAVDGYVWDTLHKTGWPLVQDTMVLWRSEPFGFPPIVALANGPARTLSRLQQVLLGMSADPAGRQLLADLNLDGFTDASESIYDGIVAMARAHGIAHST